MPTYVVDPPIHDDQIVGPFTIHAPAVGEFDGPAFYAWVTCQYLMGLDIEGTAFTKRTFWDPGWRCRLVQLGSTDTAWVLNLDDLDQFMAAATVLADLSKRFVTHTNTDVVAVYRAFGIALGQRVLDTHLLSKVINPDERAGHDLKVLSDRKLDNGLSDAEANLHRWFADNAPRAKGTRGKVQKETWGWNNIPTDTPEYVIYAGLDAIYARRLCPVLLAELEAVGHIVHLDHWLASQTTGTTIRGLQLDLARTRALLAETETEMNAANNYIIERLGFPARSPKFPVWVEDHGNLPDGLPRTEKTEILQLTMDDPVRSCKVILPQIWAAAAEWPPEDQEILRQREIVAQTANLVSNLRQFLECMDADGRVHPTINILRAKTARMSITGPAMQTLKKPDEDVPGTARLRACFRADYSEDPDDPFVLVSCDFDQVEFKVGAAHTRDPMLLKVCREGLSIHKVTARFLFGEHYNKTQYRKGKNATFCIFFGGGAKAHSGQAGTSIEESAEIVRNWHALYTGVKPYGKWIAKFSPITTGSGRRIPPDPGRDYASSNFDIQSTSRDLLVGALYRLFTAQPWMAPMLWLLVHDEVVLMCRRSQASRVCELLSEAMNFDYRGVRITATAEVLGTHWGAEETELEPAA